jgi:hypothetical protein
MFDELNPDIYPDNPIFAIEWYAPRFKPRWAMTPAEVPEWDPTRGVQISEDDRDLFDTFMLPTAWKKWHERHPDAVIQEAEPKYCPRLVSTGMEDLFTPALDKPGKWVRSYNYETQEKTSEFIEADVSRLIEDLAKIWQNHVRGYPSRRDDLILKLASEFSPRATMLGGDTGPDALAAFTREAWLISAQCVYAVLRMLQSLNDFQDPKETLELVAEMREGDMVNPERVRPHQAWYTLHNHLFSRPAKLTPAQIKRYLVDYCVGSAFFSMNLSSNDGVPKLWTVCGTGDWAMLLLARHIQTKAKMLTVKCHECGTLVPSAARGQPKKWCSAKCEIDNRRKRNTLESSTTLPQRTVNKGKSKPVKS